MFPDKNPPTPPSFPLTSRGIRLDVFDPFTTVGCRTGHTINGSKSHKNNSHGLPGYMQNNDGLAIKISFLSHLHTERLRGSGFESQTTVGPLSLVPHCLQWGQMSTQLVGGAEGGGYLH